jgi:hypothetical protein
MKNKNCLGYDADTEIVTKEIGSANGEILYSSKEIILSERCSVRNLVDDFDCSECPMRNTLTVEKK